MILPFARCALVVSIFLWPISLSIFIQRPWAIQLPASFTLGDVVLVSGDPHLKEVRLSGRKMTYLQSKDLWMGAAPSGQTELFAIWKSEISTVDFSEIVIPTRSPPLKQAKQLKLPNQIWKQMSDPNTEARARDRQILSRIMNDHSGEFQTGCWNVPLKSAITSAFGSPRRLPNGQEYYHAGEDRRALIGTKVLAAGPGRVAFSGSMVLPGNNVVIHHGGGWFTRYLHLSKNEVLEGQIVTSGDLIGFSGASGRVEAPHLHWEILWKGIPLAPDHFLQTWARLCDSKST